MTSPQISHNSHANFTHVISKPLILLCFLAAEERIKIVKKLEEKKRGECVTFQGEHYYKPNGTFVWKKRETTTMVSNDRIKISNDGKTIEISRLEEEDTAMYSSMIHTAGGLEITRHWLVVRGKDAFSGP